MSVFGKYKAFGKTLLREEFEALKKCNQDTFAHCHSKIGGRCNQECVDLVRAFVLHRSSSVAPALRASLRSLARRYWGILSVAIQRAGADCLSDDPAPVEFASLPLPSLDTLPLGIDAPFGVDAPDVSRLPPSTEH